MAKITIVDEKDSELCAKERKYIKRNDIYRVSALWITDGSENILIAQRSLNKVHAPGQWGPAVEGTVDEGETYEFNILKEAEEETGLKLMNTDLKLGPKFFIKKPFKTRFHQFFMTTIDSKSQKFRIRKSEVRDIRWISAKDLKKDIKENHDKYVTSIKLYLGVEN